MHNEMQVTPLQQNYRYFKLFCGYTWMSLRLQSHLLVYWTFQWNWCFEDFIKIAVPTAITPVRFQTWRKKTVIQNVVAKHMHSCDR